MLVRNPRSPRVLDLQICSPSNLLLLCARCTAAPVALWRMQLVANILADIGANPSAEGGDDDGAEDGAKTVNNVVYSFRLQESGFDKKGYKTYLGGTSHSLSRYPSSLPPSSLFFPARVGRGRREFKPRCALSRTLADAPIS